MSCYSQSHLGWHFQMLFQSSKFKARTSLLPSFSEKRLRALSLELQESFQKCHPTWDLLYITDFRGGRHNQRWRGGLTSTKQCFLSFAFSRVAYPGGEGSPRAPEWRIWPNDFWKKIFPGEQQPLKVQSPTSAGARGGEVCHWNMWSPVYIRESFGQRLYAG